MPQTIRRTLKLRWDTPFPVESRLVNKYGYYVVKREFQQYLMFAKTCQVDPDSRAEIPLPGTGELTELQKRTLETRCDRIADYFPDPYAAYKQVRIRLHNMMQSLPSMAERQYVLEYMDANFPLDDKGR